MYKYLHLNFFLNQSKKKKSILFLFYVGLPFPESCVVTVNKLKGKNYFATFSFMKYEKEK